MRRRTFSIAAAGAAAAWPLAGLADDFEHPPAPGPAQPWPLPQVESWRLSNGLQVALAQRRQQPLVTVRLLLDIGSLRDPAGRAGLAELSLNLLGKGAQHAGRRLGAGELAFALESLGGSLESSSTPQAGSLTLTLARPRLEEGLALLADLLRRPSLSGVELERTRAQMLDELQLGLSDPATLAAALGRRLFWGRGAYGQTPSPASLGRLRREHVLNLLRRQLRPDSTRLILAGDLTPAEARALVQERFGSWRVPRVLSAAPAGPSESAVNRLPRTLLVDLPGSGQSGVLLLAPYAGLDDAAGLDAGALAQAVLGQGYSSRLSQEVRIRRGLSYGAASTAESLPAGGMLAAFAQTQHGSAAEVAGLMRSTLLKLAREPVGAAELEARRASLLGGQARQLESCAMLAGLLAEQWLLGRTPQQLAQLPQRLAAVTAAQLQAFAARLWRAERLRLRLVVVGDLRAAGPGLRALDPQAWVMPAAELDLESSTLGHRP